MKFDFKDILTPTTIMMWLRLIAMAFGVLIYVALVIGFIYAFLTMVVFE